MNRREFTALVGGAVAWPLLARLGWDLEIFRRYSAPPASQKASSRSGRRQAQDHQRQRSTLRAAPLRLPSGV